LNYLPGTKNKLLTPGIKMNFLGDARALFDRYQSLLELYGTLERLSGEIFNEMSDGFRFDIIQKKLEEKLRIVKDIQVISHEISLLKSSASLSERDRAGLRKTEEELTLIVGRVVEMEDTNRSRFERQGVKVVR
jgi:hypothetical protein